MSGPAESIYHDGTYLRNHPTWHAEDARYKTSDILTLLARHNLRPETVCEVGCGCGAILESLSRSLGPSLRCAGYDISEQAIALCRPREQENLRFFLGSPPAGNARFDLLLLIDVLEHVDDYLGFLRQLRRIGAHTILRIPLNISIQSVLFRSAPILDTRRACGHLHYFTRETALATLEDTGYRVLDSFPTFSEAPAGMRPGRALLRACKRSLFRLRREWVARMFDGFSLMVLAE